MNFLARRKVSLNMSYTVLDSLPFPRLPEDDVRVATLAPLVLKLTCTGPEMVAYWNTMAKYGWVEPVPNDGPLPGILDDPNRLRIRARIEAVVATNLFNLTREELEYVLDTFPTTRKYDINKHGEYRSKIEVLNAYDALTTNACAYKSLTFSPNHHSLRSPS